MKTKLFYFSGTGNTFVLAKGLASGLGGDSELISIAKVMDADSAALADADINGLVFPVYAFGVPVIVENFIRKLKGEGKYFFVMCNSAGCPGFALKQAKKMLAASGIEVFSSFSLVMPSNYTPFGGAYPEKKQEKVFNKANEKIKAAVEIIKSGRKQQPGFSFLTMFSWLFSLINSKARLQFKTDSKNFRVDDKCKSCGTCAKVCPVRNVTMKDGRPVWGFKCELCFACIQWCPAEAIQYGKCTVGRKRYHHPDVKAEDLFL